MVILGWTFVYGYPDKERYLGVANTIIGNGALWAMMAAPFLIRLMGKRNLLIWSNVINIGLISLLYPFFENIWIVIAIFYLNNFVMVLSNIYNPGITADMKDYQQYLTGERIDGMFGVVGMIGTFIGFFSGLVVPAIYERYGLKTDYDVLYDAQMRAPLFRVLIICSIIGAVLNVIPYFFYDLTEKKHKGIVYVLRIRAMFDDYGYGDLSDDTLKEAMDIIKTAERLNGTQPLILSKEKIKSAKQKISTKGLSKEEKDDIKECRRKNIKAAKAEYRAQKAQNIDLELSPMVLEELKKFDTERYQKQVETAEYILANSEDLTKLYNSLLKKLCSIPTDTKINREIRSDLNKVIRTVREANKLIKEFYPNGVSAPDNAALENAQKLPTDTIIKVVSRKLAVKKVLKEQSVYKRATLPVNAANAIVREEKAYKCMDELEERYLSLTAVTAE